MFDRIFNQISKADVLIADMTGRNPNVFYEVGYAHALGKIVILVTQNADDIPFDLKHRQHIIYGGRIDSLKTQLTERLRWAILSARSSENLERPNHAFVIAVNNMLLTPSPRGITGPVVDIESQWGGFELRVIVSSESLEIMPSVERITLLREAFDNETPEKSTLRWTRSDQPLEGHLILDDKEVGTLLQSDIPPLPKDAVHTIRIQGSMRPFTSIECECRLHLSFANFTLEYPFILSVADR
jgi:hypothetical protein